MSDIISLNADLSEGDCDPSVQKNGSTTQSIAVKPPDLTMGERKLFFTPVVVKNHLIRNSGGRIIVEIHFLPTPRR